MVRLYDDNCVPYIENVSIDLSRSSLAEESGGGAGGETSFHGDDGLPPFPADSSREDRRRALNYNPRTFSLQLVPEKTWAQDQFRSARRPFSDDSALLLGPEILGSNVSSEV